MMKNIQRAIRVRFGEPMAFKKTFKLIVPGVGGLFKPIDSLPKPIDMIREVGMHKAF